MFANLLYVFFLFSYADSSRLSQLRDGFYQSQNKKCERKRLITISKNEETFYLIGKNRRFLISPKYKARSESQDNCLYTYTSESKDNTFLETKTTLCGKSKTTERTTLIIMTDKSFKLSIDKAQECIYQFQEEL